MSWCGRLADLCCILSRARRLHLERLPTCTSARPTKSFTNLQWRRRAFLPPYSIVTITNSRICRCSALLISTDILPGLTWRLRVEVRARELLRDNPTCMSASQAALHNAFKDMTAEDTKALLMSFIWSRKFDDHAFKGRYKRGKTTPTPRR